MVSHLGVHPLIFVEFHLFDNSVFFCALVSGSCYSLIAVELTGCLAYLVGIYGVSMAAVVASSLLCLSSLLSLSLSLSPPPPAPGVEGCPGLSGLK